MTEPMQARGPETASAADQPCIFHGYHWPPVIETEGHHMKPVYLQNRLYGKIVDGTLGFVCPTGHTNFHAWIAFLLGERRRRPFRLGTRKEMKHAKDVVAWYFAEKARLGR